MEQPPLNKATPPLKMNIFDFPEEFKISKFQFPLTLGGGGEGGRGRARDGGEHIMPAALRSCL